MRPNGEMQDFTRRMRVFESSYLHGMIGKSGHAVFRNDHAYLLVSRQPAASASSTEQNQRVPLLIVIWILAYQRLVGW